MSNVTKKITTAGGGMLKAEIEQTSVDKTTKEIETFFREIQLNPDRYDGAYTVRKKAPFTNPQLIGLSRILPENLEAYERLIADSQNSYDHFKALKLITADWIEINDQEMPEVLKCWLQKFLRGAISIPKKRKGKKTDYQKRLWIAVAAFKVIDKGFPKGRADNNTDNEVNAFSIVANAAKNAGWRGVTYATVRDYYYQMQHLA